MKQHEIHESISGLDRNSEPDLFLDIQNEPNLYKDDCLLEIKHDDIQDGRRTINISVPWLMTSVDIYSKL